MEELLLPWILSLLALYVVIRMAVAHGIKDALAKAQLAHHVADIRTVVTEVLRQGQPARQSTTEEPVDPDTPWFKRP